MSDDFQTYATLARTLDVSVAAIKSWRRKFPGALPLLTRGKPLRFAPEALAACRAIHEGYGEGRSTTEVRAHLEATLPWMGRMPGAADAGQQAPTGAGVQHGAGAVRVHEAGAPQSTHVPENTGQHAPHPAAAPAGQGADASALEALASTMAALLSEQRASARRLERLEQRLDQMHGHPKLLEELRSLKRRQQENVQAAREGLGEPDSGPEQQAITTSPEPTTDGQPARQRQAAAADDFKGVDQNKQPETAASSQDDPRPTSLNDEPAHAAPPADEQSGRVVRIRTRSGEYERYELKPLGPEATEPTGDAASGPPTTTATGPESATEKNNGTPTSKAVRRERHIRTEPPVPPDEFLDLPVVTQDVRGDYLGVPGLTVRLLAARLEYGTTWEPRGELWLLTMNTLPAQTLTLTPTVTPRGNRVAALTRLATPNSESDAAGRIEFLRSLKQ